ncbi:MAG: TRAP transporter small permease subunit [Candidatus Bathyarchaeota archaeon]
MSRNRKNGKNMFFRVIDWINETVGRICFIFIVASGVILVYEVLVRYIFRIPTVWEIETSIYLIMFVTLVGAGYGLKHNAHINVDLVIRLLPPKVRHWLLIVGSILSLTFAIFVAWRGLVLWWTAYSLGWRTGTLFNPPLAIPYAFIPLGMILLSLQYIVYIAELISKKPEEVVKEQFSEVKDVK